MATRHQGSGIGTQVMRRFMDEAVPAGLHVELFVLKANARARALYTRLGFVVAEELSANEKHRP